MRHAILGLLEEQPRHGYELKRLYDDRFLPAQPARFGQVYATLARLDRDGLVNVDEIQAGGGPDRKTYAVTPEGIADLKRWLLSPEPPDLFGRRVLFTKVALALAAGRPPHEILSAQKIAHLNRMRQLTAGRAGATFFDTLVSDFELFHLEADIRWMELADERSGAWQRKGTR